MKISPVSFKSTYIIDSKRNDMKKYNIVSAIGTKIDVNVYFSTDIKQQDILLTGIVANDKDDKKVEKYLKQNNVIYTKKSHKDLLSEESIRHRLFTSADNKCIFMKYLPSPIEVDTKKLDMALKRKNKSVVSIFDTSDNTRYGWIKSGLPIQIPIVNVTNNRGKANADYLHDISDFAVMRDLGFKTIPVVMDMHSFAAAYETGLIKED